MAESAILDAIHTAAKFLGYSQLRKPQESHFLIGRDVFVTLPTGSGKSLACAITCSLKLLTNSR